MVKMVMAGLVVEESEFVWNIWRIITLDSSLKKIWKKFIHETRTYGYAASLSCL